MALRRINEKLITNLQRFMGEASIWAGLHHPRILEFYGICDYGGLTLFMVCTVTSMYYSKAVIPFP